MNLKVCVPSVSEAILSVRDGRTSGLGLPMIHELLDMVRKNSQNLTFILSRDKFGDIVNSSESRYDGCIGALHRMDVALAPTYYPMVAPNITNGVILSSSKTVIVTSYNNHFRKSKTDVLEFFKAFNLSLWLLIFVTTFILIGVQILIIRIKRRRRSVTDWAANILISASLKQFSSLNIKTYRKTVRFVLMLIIVFVFQIHFFLTSMIKTEMVVQETPETISSYEEVLLHQKCEPLWFEGLSIHHEFQNSAPDSMAGKIWQKALKSGLQNHFVNFDFEKLMSYAKDSGSKEKILFVPGYAIDTISTNLCAVLRTHGVLKDSNIWHRIDPTAKDHIMVAIRSSNIPGEKARLLDVTYERILEHGLFLRVISLLKLFAAEVTEKSDVKECMANRIIYPENELHSVILTHFSGLWKLLAAASVLSLIVFLSEVCVRCVHVFLVRLCSLVPFRGF